MFCPKCQSEYRPGFDACADCGVLLVEDLPVDDLPVEDPPVEDPPVVQHEARETVVVFSTGSAPLLSLAESLLRSGGIEYISRGSGLQDLLGAGRLGGFNPIAGPAELIVDAEFTDEAHALLSDLSEEPAEPREVPATPSESEEAPSHDLMVAKRRFRAFVVLDLALMAIVTRLANRSYAELPPEVLKYLWSQETSANLTLFFNQFYYPMLALQVLVAIGLLNFWRPARALYAFTWIWWLAEYSWGPLLRPALGALLSSLNALVGGAIIACSFLDPLRRVFDRKLLRR